MLVILVVLAGFALLLQGLDRLQMWGDSSYSVMVARQSLLEITLGRTVDGHPPLFYYLLHFWLRLVGQSELALRFLSIGMATACLAAVYRMGRLLFQNNVALLATALTAISPLLVFESRLIRMYSLFSFLTVLALGFLLVALRDNRRRGWLCYGVTALLALYTHYYALLFLLAGACYFLARWRRHRRLVRPWLATNLALAVLYVPWLWFAGPTSAQTTAGIISNAPSPRGALGYLGETVWASFQIGVATDAERAAPMVIAALAAVAVLGLLAWRFAPASAGGDGTPILTMLIAVVAVAGLLFLAVPYAVRPRFLMPAVPLYLLLFSWLVWRVATRRAAIALIATIAVAGTMAFALVETFASETRLFEPEAVALTTKLQDLARADDAIVFHAGWQSGYFTSHFGLPLPRLFSIGDVPADRAAAILRPYPRVWLARYDHAMDNPRSLAVWLERNWLKGAVRNIGDLRLIDYVPPAKPEALRPADLRFNAPTGVPLFRVSGYSAGPSVVQPGQSITVGLRWQLLTEPVGRYTVFVHLIDEKGERVAGHDGEPGGGSRPTNQWRAGETIDDGSTLVVPPALPPGRYHLRVGLYGSDDPKAQPLKTAASDLDTITVEARPVVLPPRVRRIDARFAENVTLLGAELDHDGVGDWTGRLIRTADGPVFLTDLRESYRPGEAVHLSLYWTVARPADRNYTVTVIAISDKRVAAEAVGPRYPVEKWQTGALVVDEYSVPLPKGMAPGRYSLSVAVRVANGQALNVAGAGDRLAIRSFLVEE